MQVGCKPKEQRMLPVPRSCILAKREEILRYHRKFECKKRPKRAFSAVIPQPFPNTQHLNNSSLDTPLKNSRQTTNTLSDSTKSRPLSQQPSRCHYRSSSPLSVTKPTHSYSQHMQPISRPGIQKNFLKKGQSVERTIIKNLLTSKLARPCQTALSYCDVPQNHCLIQPMKNEIPFGLRDMVGAEEMMRMSHIVMGIEIKTVNLRQIVGRVFEQTKARRNHFEKHKKDDGHEEEEDTTLRSIKRW